MKYETLIANVVDWGGGSRTRLAARLGCSESAVAHWLNDRGIPGGRACQIQILSRGKFSARDLIAPDQRASWHTE